MKESKDKITYGIPKDRLIYGNCQVLSPDGHLMFRCEEKRIKWYLSRNLAEIVNDSPPTIKLTFKPKGLGNHDKNYGLTIMTNQCVNCGSSEYLSRHHVVPYCYRKFFPNEHKSHNFHDVLSVCVECHNLYERKADKLKYDLSIEYNAPIQGEINNDAKEKRKYAKIASTLLDINNNLPKSRIDELYNKVRNYLNKDPKQNDLIILSNIDCKILNRTHGEIVMSKVNNIESFIRIWREHFILNNECKFLPDNWNINNKIKSDERE